MQLTELSSLFRSTYELQANLRNMKVQRTPENLVASMMAEAQMEIQRVLHVLQVEYTLVCDGTSTRYVLPLNFGKLIDVYTPASTTDPSPSASTQDYHIVSRTQLTQSIIEAAAYDVATWIDTLGVWIEFSTAPAAGNLTLLYEVEPGTFSPSSAYGQIANFAVDGNGNITQTGTDPSTLALTPSSEISGVYTPSGGASGAWGYWDGVRYLGNVQFPDRYIPAILSYMLGKVFPEYLSLTNPSVDSFPNRIKGLKGSQMTSLPKVRKYRFG